MTHPNRRKVLQGSQSLEGRLERHLKDRRFRADFIEHYLEAEVAERLYKLREGRRLTQKDLAARARMQQNAVSRIEKGANSLTLRTVQRMAGALGYRVLVDFKPLGPPS